jgi:hypothetical protein
MDVSKQALTALMEMSTQDMTGMSFEETKKRRLQHKKRRNNKKLRKQE